MSVRNKFQPITMSLQLSKKEVSTKDVWARHIAFSDVSSQDYFRRVLERVVRESKGVKNVVVGKHPADDNRDHLACIGICMEVFFKGLVDRSHSRRAVMNACIECGKRHAYYADWTFEVRVSFCVSGLRCLISRRAMHKGPYPRFIAKNACKLRA